MGISCASEEFSEHFRRVLEGIIGINDVCPISDPLWKLTKNRVQWKWTEVEQKAFQDHKNAISTQCMGYYFWKDWETELISDASPVGLGVVLCQFNPKDTSQRHIKSFFSRMLTEVEQRYSKAEKEALGVVWICEKAAIFRIGHRFRIVVDNRAVMLIYGNARSKAPESFIQGKIKKKTTKNQDKSL